MCLTVQLMSKGKGATWEFCFVVASTDSLNANVFCRLIMNVLQSDNFWQKFLTKMNVLQSNNFWQITLAVLLLNNRVIVYTVYNLRVIQLFNKGLHAQAYVLSPVL